VFAEEISETRESIEKEPVWLLLAGVIEVIERGGVGKRPFDVTAVGRCGFVVDPRRGKMMDRKKKKKEFDYLMMMC
jgi:hypothetical protein